jgi:hypothetical protein
MPQQQCYTNKWNKIYDTTESQYKTLTNNDDNEFRIHSAYLHNETTFMHMAVSFKAED